MKIGMVTDFIGHLSFTEMLDTTQRLGVNGGRIQCGNWTSAPHINLKQLLGGSAERREFLRAAKTRGLIRRRSTLRQFRGDAHRAWSNAAA
jgi:sugar phosphate isomerase/epimerase